MHNYHIKTQKKSNGKGYWDYTIVEIFSDDKKIGEYIRKYPSHTESTFVSVSYNGKDYALYSSDYQAISVMSLPDCKEIKLTDECKKQMYSFCPIEIMVPKLWILSQEIDGVKHYYAYQKVDRDKEDPNFKDAPTYDSTVGFALGCVWGDDSSFKLNLLDLSNIENGEIWYINNEKERKWLYEEFPDSLYLKDLRVDFDESVNELTGEIVSLAPDSYLQLKQKFVSLSKS